MNIQIMLDKDEKVIGCMGYDPDMSDKNGKLLASALERACAEYNETLEANAKAEAERKAKAPYPSDDLIKAIAMLGKALCGDYDPDEDDDMEDFPCDCCEKDDCCGCGYCDIDDDFLYRCI